jgi:mono/diheme cytochrome c family protein
MTRPKAILAAVFAAIIIFAALAIIIRDQKSIANLVAENVSLQHQLQQAQADRQAALDKAMLKEKELEVRRLDTAELNRLREEMKTNLQPEMPTGFYIGTDHPIFVKYGTSDPLLRSFMKSLMDANHDPVSKGRAVFEKVCAACHQHDGLGRNFIAPPLVGSEWVLAPTGERLVRIVLNGVTGPITVNDREWNLTMPALRETLDNDAIAYALTYVRSGLGTNNAEAIKPSLVDDARDEAHSGPETATELLQIAVH